MATWENRWDGNVLFCKTSGMLSVEEAHRTLVDFRAAWDKAPAGRFGIIVDLSDYPTQSAEVADITAETAAVMKSGDTSRIACVAIVVAKTTTKMQLTRQENGHGLNVYCDDLAEARAAVEQVLKTPAAV